MTHQPSQHPFPYLSQATMTATLRRVAGALPQDPDATPEDRAIDIKAAAAAIAALRPRDPMEATLAARIVVMQAMHMACFRRANQPGLPETLRIRNINQGAMLCRMEDAADRALRQRQAHPIAAPAAIDVDLPEPHPQAPYVAPQAVAARKPSPPVAAAPSRQTVAQTPPTTEATATDTQTPDTQAAATQTPETQASETQTPEKSAALADAHPETATAAQLRAELAARTAAGVSKLAA